MHTWILAISLIAGSTLATQASAFSFAPKSASFKGDGNITLTKGVATLFCKQDTLGFTDAAGVMHITSAIYRGGRACKHIVATGLPWTATAMSSTKGVIANVAFDAGPLHACGPGDVPFKLIPPPARAQFRIRFHAVTIAHGCMVDGHIRTMPQFHIDNP